MHQWKKEREDIIVEMLGANSEKIQKLQEQQHNYVLNKIIDQNPGLLSKKVGISTQHRTNALECYVCLRLGFVLEKLDDSDNSNPSLKPCFFGTAVPLQMGHTMFQLTSESFGF